MTANEAISRQMKKQLYSGLQYRTFRNSLLRRLIEGYGYDNKIEIARRLVAEIIDLIEESMPLAKRVKPGQLVWLARSATDKKSRGQSSKDFEKVTVILDLLSESDIDALINGSEISVLRKERSVRLIKDAAIQGAALSTTEVGAICGLSPSTVSGYVRSHEGQTGKLLPTAGTVLDLGPKITHKVEAVRYWLHGYEPLEIAQKMDHALKNIETYITDFKRVRMIARKHLESEAPFLLKMSPRLVSEYWSLVEEYYPDELYVPSSTGPEDGAQGDGCAPPEGRRVGASEVNKGWSGDGGVLVNEHSGDQIKHDNLVRSIKEELE
jgi:hypothetical protein